MGSSQVSDLFPLEFAPELSMNSVDDLVSLIIQETEHQMASRKALDEQAEAVEKEDADEFQIGCDALNYERVLWRCREELGHEVPLDVDREIARLVAKTRDYEPEEFDLAKEAVRHRVRSPYGLSLLQLVLKRAERNPIKLTNPELTESELLTLVAGIALQLQLVRGDGYILLPLDRLRSLLKRRKIVVGGAIQRLQKYGLLKEISPYLAGSAARRLRFTAEKGKDYEFVVEAQGTASQTVK